MHAHPLTNFPIHLGRGGRASVEPEFTGAEWYQQYGERHADDLDDSRLVSLFTYESNWGSWEMHPEGDEVVVCIQGSMVLHQELADGSTLSIPLNAGEYAINPAGTWHTADASERVSAVFVTVGKGTQNRPRE